MKKLLHPIVDAEAILGVGRTSIYELGRRGELEMVKIGARTLITDVSLEALVERLRARQLYPTAKAPIA